MSNESQLTDSSLGYIRSATLEKRKKLGQYMTPKSIRDIALAHLPLKNGDKVLDPAVGTGELLLAAKAKNMNMSLYGWDIDEEILKTARTNLGSKAKLELVDGLSVSNRNNFFDAVIANPPYFELKLSEELKSRYADVVSGRANIYALFIKQVIEVTKEDGYIALIVPPSMNNGEYFNSLREFILSHTEVKFLKVITDPSLFIEAQTSTQVIILQKKKNPKWNNKYILDLQALTHSPKQRILLTEDALATKRYWEGCESIYSLGYEVITGTLTWNKYRSVLSEKQKIDSLPVYYSKDIGKDGKIHFSESQSAKRYLKRSEHSPLNGKAIIVNRIVGGVGSGSIRAALVEGEYFAENHVNVIAPRSNAKQTITLKALHRALTQDPSISDYLKIFTGNTQLSASELKYFIPIKLSDK